MNPSTALGRGVQPSGRCSPCTQRLRSYFSISALLFWIVEQPGLYVRLGLTGLRPVEMSQPGLDRPTGLDQASHWILPSTSHRCRLLRIAKPPAAAAARPAHIAPTKLAIEVKSGGLRELRLANTIWNSGSVPLELMGEFNPDTRRTRVRQLVYDLDLRLHEFDMGEFVWHPKHDHWHMEGFAIYRLWSVAPNGELDRVVSSSDKLSTVDGH
jgi:hypothetical protein